MTTKLIQELVVADKQEWVKAKEKEVKKCGCTGCENIATHTWSGHPTCNGCAASEWRRGLPDKIFATDEVESTERWCPVVGEECEAYDYESNCYFKSIYIGDNPRDKTCGSFKVFMCLDDNDLFWSDEFRPIKTQEDVEREEGIEALRKLLSKGVGDCEPDKYLATVIWDEGYRKV